MKGRCPRPLDEQTKKQLVIRNSQKDFSRKISKLQIPNFSYEKRMVRLSYSHFYCQTVRQSSSPPNTKLSTYKDTESIVK